LAVGP